MSSNTPNPPISDRVTRNEMSAARTPRDAATLAMNKPFGLAAAIVEQRDHHENADEQDHCDGGSKRIILRLDRLLVDIERHVHQLPAADKRLDDKGADCSGEDEKRAAEKTRHGQWQGDLPPGSPWARTQCVRR